MQRKKTIVRTKKKAKKQQQKRKRVPSFHEDDYRPDPEELEAAEAEERADGSKV